MSNGRNLLSQPTINLIEQAIKKTNSSNRYVLCQEIAELLEAKFPGGNLPYQTKRMKLDTTKKILMAIDYYFSFEQRENIS